MARVIFRRIAWAIPTLWLIVTISFFLMRAAPGGPFDIERPLDPIVMENLRRIYQFDEPLWRQYLSYVAALAHGDFGPSYYWRDFSVAELFAKALPISAGLGATALALAVVVGSAAGAFAASHGPDALAITLDELAERLGRTDRAVKPALMDQKLVAGIGNIYAEPSPPGLFLDAVAPAALPLDSD